MLDARRAHSIYVDGGSLFGYRRATFRHPTLYGSRRVLENEQVE